MTKTLKIFVASNIDPNKNHDINRNVLQKCVTISEDKSVFLRQYLYKLHINRNNEMKDMDLKT